jgi:hypothetical protein
MVAMACSKFSCVGATVLATAALGLGCGPSNAPAAATTPSVDGSAPDGSAPDGSAPDGGSTPFEPVSPYTYVPKLKNVLVGLPATEDEIQAVKANPAALKTLISGWMQLPQYGQKLMRFFQLAFQQTQVSVLDFADQSYPRNIVFNTGTAPLLMQNAQESFARTMAELLVAQHHPLTESFTVQQFMMTTALKELYTFLDVWQVNDNGTITDRFVQAHPTLGAIYAGTAQGPIPISETLDPRSPNYMHWYNPDAATEDATVPGCPADPIRYLPSAYTLHILLYGSLDNRKGVGGVGCPQLAGSPTATQFQPSDFTDWTMVTVRKPNAGETVPAFYDLPALRQARELVLNVPRVGFFSTPAFHANWQTNTSNQMRVTLNQALIVALGSSIDGTDTTVPPGSPPPGIDEAHALPPACYSCHRTLDPLRSILSANYSWNYHNQNDPALAAQNGMFAFRGVIQPVNSLAEFGAVLGSHPLFASAWAQKLCYYVNSAPCASDDPEFLRVVETFKSSGYHFDTLVTELLASPIVTRATKTANADGEGEVIAVSRRDHLCAALDARLGFADVCALDVTSRKQGVIPSVAAGLPSDGYGRGSETPVLPNAPTLFYRAGVENICVAAAAQVIDVAKPVSGVKQWSSSNPDAAIADFVSTVMALAPSDPRASAALDLLKAHFTQAKAQGVTASDALKSTFVAACLAPSSISMGL